MGSSRLIWIGFFCCFFEDLKNQKVLHMILCNDIVYLKQVVQKVTSMMGREFWVPGWQLFDTIWHEGLVH